MGLEQQKFLKMLSAKFATRLVIREHDNFLCAFNLTSIIFIDK